jgi:hypothetical protein
MQGVGFAERYVIARESNVVRVDFARRPDPPAPRFPGAGGYGPRRGESLQWIRANRKLGVLPLHLRGRVDGSVLCCVVSPLPVAPPQAERGVEFAFELPSVVGLEVNLGQERRKGPCGAPCFRLRSSLPSP